MNGGKSKMIKKLLSLVTVFLIGVLMSSFVNASHIDISQVKVDGDVITESSTNFILDVDRGDEIEVKVQIKGSQNVDDVQIEAALRGFDSDDTIEDITETFNVKSNVTYVKELTLPLVKKLDQDRYKLRIRVDDRDSHTVEKTFELEVDTKQHDVEVRDIVLSPNDEVRAGRALLATVRLRNLGEKDEEGVKVVVSMPELGISAADFVDELEREDDNDDEATSEEMFLRIPDNAETGQYTLRVEVWFDEGDKKSVKETTINVLGQETSTVTKTQDKTIIAVGADKQAAVAGSGEVAYPITLTNSGASSKTYTVSADGASWAKFRVSPSNVVVLGAGESKTVTVFVAVNKNAPSGEQTFTVTISSNDKMLKQLPLSVSVQAGSSLKKGLEVGLVVLVILLVIIGLIIGFSKMRGDDEGNDKEKTYY